MTYHRRTHDRFRLNESIPTSPNSTGCGSSLIRAKVAVRWLTTGITLPRYRPGWSCRLSVTRRRAVSFSRRRRPTGRQPTPAPSWRCVEPQTSPPLYFHLDESLDDLTVAVLGAGQSQGSSTAPGVHGVLCRLKALRATEVRWRRPPARRSCGTSRPFCGGEVSQHERSADPAAGWTPDADAHHAESRWCPRLTATERSTVVTGHAAAELEPDAARTRCRVSSCDQPRCRQAAPSRTSASGPTWRPGLVHVGRAAWPARSIGRRCRPVATSAPDFLCTLKPEPMRVGQDVGDKEAEVVPGRGVVAVQDCPGRPPVVARPCSWSALLGSFSAGASPAVLAASAPSAASPSAWPRRPRRHPPPPSPRRSAAATTLTTSISGSDTSVTPAGSVIGARGELGADARRPRPRR